jgi:hyperosmotically inducible periplasmic protein
MRPSGETVNDKPTNKKIMKTRVHKFILPLAAAVALAGFTGCESTKGDDRTAGRTMDDKAVTGKVKDALSEQTVYKFDDIDVATHNGIVQLSGWASTEAQKQKAAEVARQVEGVHDVLNNISVKLTPTGREGEKSGYPANTNNVPPRSDAPTKSTEP